MQQPAIWQLRSHLVLMLGKAVGPAGFGWMCNAVPVLGAACRKAACLLNMHALRGMHTWPLIMSANSDMLLTCTLENMKKTCLSPLQVPATQLTVLHECLQENANRLKAYKSKLVVFPRNKKKVKQGDASADELQMAAQLHTRRVMPMVHEKPAVEYMEISEDMKVGGRWPAFLTFRLTGHVRSSSLL